MLAQYLASTGRALDFIIISMILHRILANTSRTTLQNQWRAKYKHVRLKDHWRKYNSCHIGVHIYRRTKIVASR